MSEDKPYVAKVVHLRVSIDNSTAPEKMGDYVAHLKRTLLEDPVWPAKNVTALGEEYIADGQRVTVGDFENPKPEAKKKTKAKKSETTPPNQDASEEYNPTAIPLMFDKDVDPEVVDYLREADPQRVVNYRKLMMADDQIMSTLQGLEEMQSASETTERD